MSAFRISRLQAGLWLAVSAAAAADDTHPESLEAVTVTASALGQTDLHLAQPASVLSGQELRNKLAPTIGETLSREPGISSSPFGGGASRPVIRGLAGSRVRLLESGISTMDVSNLSPDHAVSIEPLAATQIEVLKGPATLLYGSGAAGGVVNVVTNRIASELPGKPSGQIDLRYDTVSEGRAGAFVLDGALRNFALHLDGSAREADDYDIPGFATVNPAPGDPEGELPGSDVEADNLTGGASYIGDWGFLGFDIGHYATNYGIPGEGARIELAQLRYDLKGEIAAPLPHVKKLKLQLGHVDYKHQEIEPTGEVGTTFLNDEFEGRIELLHAPLGPWRGAAGMQIGQRDFEAVGEEALTPPLIARSAGLFLVEERDWADWHFELGGRVEHQGVKPEDGTSGAEHLVYSASGGTIWEFMPHYSAGLYLTRAQRAPSVEELYNDGPHLATSTFEAGNANLSEETANNVDLTLRKPNGNWTWQVNFYANYIEDFIFADSVDAGGDGVADRVDEDGNPSAAADALLRIDYAQEDAIFHGAEAETTLGLYRGALGEIDGRLRLDFVRGRLTSGDNLPRITPLRYGGGLDWRRGRWLGALDVLRVTEQTHNAALETETGGYTMLDVNVSYTFATRPADYVFTLRGNNLLDEEARAHTSFLKDLAPLPGRGLMLELRAAF